MKAQWPASVAIAAMAAATPALGRRSAAEGAAAGRCGVELEWFLYRRPCRLRLGPGRVHRHQ